MMIIHEKGPKAERDRAAFLSKYYQLTEHFHVKRLEPAALAKLNNQSLYHLGEDLFNSQSERGKRRFFESQGLLRARPLAFKWFVRDLLAFYPRAKLWVKAWHVIRSPFLYPGFVIRSRANLAKKQAVKA
ncbi:MAG: hypothetical protein WCG80_16900 [Spirochaetales bacterium]